jgi:hypothetical protein
MSRLFGRASVIPTGFERTSQRPKQPASFNFCSMRVPFGRQGTLRRALLQFDWRECAIRNAEERQCPRSDSRRIRERLNLLLRLLPKWSQLRRSNKQGYAFASPKS